MLGRDEIVKRFGIRKPTIERLMQAAQLHSAVCDEFILFAEILDRAVPDGRAKETMFTRLEETAMWAHKAMAEVLQEVAQEENKHES